MVRLFSEGLKSGVVRFVSFLISDVFEDPLLFLKADGLGVGACDFSDDFFVGFALFVFFLNTGRLRCDGVGTRLYHPLFRRRTR